ncbi:MAG: hypothetical protein QGH20_02540 [Candidatus Latescibacteria bacterium]|nr:hypothetical protein [Candidatus Latescibacterota bacterium]
MKSLVRLVFLLVMVAGGGVVVIKLVRQCSWREAFEIADHLLADLLKDGDESA